MSETGERPRYNLEALEVDYSLITARKEADQYYLFEVPDVTYGRALALEISRGLLPYSLRDFLEDPRPIEDRRLDGNQISYSEYDEDEGTKGPITHVEVYMRYGHDDPEYVQRFENAVQRVLSKVTVIE